MNNWSRVGVSARRIVVLMATVSAFALGSAVLTSPAMAEDAADDATFEFEEITVTARKRDESVQNIPISITALSAQLVEDGNFDEMNEFLELVPNVKFKKDTFTSSDISIRGSGRNIPSEDPGVGLNRDGVYIGGLVTNFSNFYDTARVEILRGPQAGLYGRNAVGGAVNVYSRKPVHNETTGYIDGQYSTFQRLELRGAVNLSLVEDKLSVRFSGLVLDQNKGFQRVVNQDQYADAFSNTSVRGRMLYTPNENLELLTTVEYFKTNGRPSGIRVNGPGGIDTLYGPGTTIDDLDNMERDVAFMSESEQIQAIQEVNWNFDAGLLTAIVAYRDTTLTSKEDNDGTPLVVNIVEADAAQQATFAEVRFASEDRDGFHYIVGATYQNEDIKNNENYTLGSLFGVDLASWFDTGLVGANPFGIPAGVPIAAFGWTPAPGGGGWFGAFGDSFPVVAINEQNLSSIAFFAEANYQITDELEIWANARYTRDSKSIVFGQAFADTCPVACPQVFATFLGIDPVYADVDNQVFTKFSPGGGVNYTVNEDFMVYAKVVTGFKAGGFNDTSGSAENIAFGQEDTISYEIGSKYRGWDKRLTLNVAAFYQKRSEAIVEIVDPIMPINSIGINAGSITNQGIELEARILPVEGLEIMLVGGYLDAKFDEFTTNGDDFSGNNVPNTFKYTFTSVVRYTKPITTDIDGFGYVSYTNAWDGYVDNFNFKKNDSPETVDLRLGLKGENWKLVGYVDNLFDHRFVLARDFEYGDPEAKLNLRDRGQFNKGRTVGVQAAYYF